MTVAQLRALLANYPDDTPVVFTADMGSISTSEPIIELDSDIQPCETLFIHID